MPVENLDDALGADVSKICSPGRNKNDLTNQNQPSKESLECVDVAADVQRHRLMQLRHALNCTKNHNECTITPYCWRLKTLWKHLLHCKNDYCKVPLCISSRFVLYHYGHCTDDNCNVCVPVKETIKRTHTEDEERELLKAAPKRLRVSKSQSNMNIFHPRSKSSTPDHIITEDGRKTRIIRDGEENNNDMAPIISKLEVMRLASPNNNNHSNQQQSSASSSSS